MVTAVLRHRWLLGGLLVVVMGCSEATSPPPDGVVRGTVARIYTDEPIVGAEVTLAGETRTTDSLGFFQFAHAPQGPADLVVVAAAYRDERRAITVGPWQTVAVTLTPLDSLVTLTGHVHHRQDGPLQVLLTVAGREVRSDSDGDWSIDDVDLGPTTVIVDHPPYNRLQTQVVVAAEGQFVDLRLTRDLTVQLAIENDAYVCTEDDSLNANRGQVDVLWASPSLGRTALLGLPAPDPELGPVQIARATLLLHGNLRPEGEEWDGVTRLRVLRHWISEPFYENAVDGVQRPGWTPAGADTLDLEPGPPGQPITLDISEAFTLGAPTFGVALAMPTGQNGLGIASSEFGPDDGPQVAWRPRVEYVVRF
ncbi:MAG: hypothetical protein R3D98_16715 [Candidatus Krumholzibacteriia bacterium]